MLWLVMGVHVVKVHVCVCVSIQFTLLPYVIIIIAMVN